MDIHSQFHVGTSYPSSKTKLPKKVINAPKIAKYDKMQLDFLVGSNINVIGIKKAQNGHRSVNNALLAVTS